MHPVDLVAGLALNVLGCLKGVRVSDFFVCLGFTKVKVTHMRAYAGVGVSLNISLNSALGVGEG
jgi:hypothetical protein